MICRIIAFLRLIVIQDSRLAKAAFARRTCQAANHLGYPMLALFKIEVHNGCYDIRYLRDILQTNHTTEIMSALEKSSLFGTLTAVESVALLVP
jgi:hypothetical protein